MTPETVLIQLRQLANLANVSQSELLDEPIARNYFRGEYFAYNKSAELLETALHPKLGEDSISIDDLLGWAGG